ncbi:MAG: GNAT family N-acetyltransferase [Actinoallomurus sp.]
MVDPRLIEQYAAEAWPAAEVQAEGGSGPAEEHTALDTLLAERGYRRNAPTMVCTAPTSTVITRSRPPARPDVTLAEHPTRRWLDAYVALDDHENSRQTADRILSRIPGPAAYLSVEHGDRVAGMGLIVAAPGYGGVFCMATHSAHRRQGIATAILHVGARWAAARGADQLYLQVMADQGHDAARRLYDRVGFRASHTYHYRLKP